MDYNKHLGIDLHIHSTASDGTLSPSEILSSSASLQLGAISITDHDTISGSQDALRYGIPPSMKFLTGVEISATPPSSFPCSGSFHVLGYAFKLDDPTLNQTLDVLQQARKNRNPRIINRLNKLGFDISLDEVLQEAGGGQLGRPHIARVLIKKGLVSSINEVFDKYLGKNKAAYVDKYRVDCAEAIKIISGAGGIPVLAHPGLIKSKSDKTYEDLLITLKEMGLKGVEVYYPEHSPKVTAHFAELAQRYQLLLTGGTDFHGSLKPEIKLGSGKGDLFVPFNLYERLIQAVGNNQSL